jgi:putative ABC transport system permease protein
MTSLRPLLARLRALVGRSRMDRDLDDEIAGHLAEAADEFVRQGLSPEDAQLAARRSFGGVAQTKEVYRQVRSFGWLDDVTRDVRFGARMLRRDGWVTLAAVGTLAIGIAANVTMFATVNALLLRDLPFDEPDRVVAIGTRDGGARTLRSGVSYPDVQDWRAASQTLEGLGAMREVTMNLSDERIAPERVAGSYVSANAFGLLRRRPLLGRDFVAEDDRRGAAPVVILGHSVWRTRYSSDPNVVGRTTRVNGVPSVVIGVMPDGFGFPTRSQAWQPLALLPADVLADRGARVLSAFGRLAPGVGMGRAIEDLERSGRTLAEQHPTTNHDVAPIAAPFHERSIGRKGRTTFPLLMGVAGIVLLMACANVANLLLARAAVRSHEISIRVAIGAGRGQIIRQLLVESLLLAALAGAVGWALSVAAIHAISGALPSDLPYWIRFTMDSRVLAFSVAVSVATALLCGLVPAVQTSRPAAGTLAETGRAGGGTARSRRWSYGLVVFQLALTPVLLTGGGLILRSIVAQYEIDAGVDSGGLLSARFDLPDATYPTSADRVRFYRQLDERLARVPGLTTVIASHAPFGGGMSRNLWRDHETVGSQVPRPRVLVVTTGPRYFDAFRTRLVRGSELPLVEPRDGASAILNEWLAASVFPGEDPIGRRIRLTPMRGTSSEPEWFTVVGIAPNIRQSGTADVTGRDGVVYVSYGTNPGAGARLIARSTVEPPMAAALLREQVRAVDPDLPLFDVMTVNDLLDASDERVGLRVFGSMFVVFATVALLLATVGLYAVTAYAAAQRTREIGLRVALGARPTQIVWLVARSAAVQLGVGLSIGMVGAVGIGHLLKSLLVGTNAIDPVTLFGVAAVLVVVGVAACLVPARRAMRLDPAAVFRDA